MRAGTGNVGYKYPTYAAGCRTAHPKQPEKPKAACYFAPSPALTRGRVGVGVAFHRNAFCLPLRKSFRYDNRPHPNPPPQAGEGTNGGGIRHCRQPEKREFRFSAAPFSGCLLLYITSKTSMPKSSKPCLSTRPASSARRRRLLRWGASALSIGQAS